MRTHSICLAALLVIFGASPAHAGALIVDFSIDEVLGFPGPAAASGTTRVVLTGVDSMGVLTGTSARGTLQSFRGVMTSAPWVVLSDPQMLMATVVSRSNFELVRPATGSFDGAGFSFHFDFSTVGSIECTGPAALCDQIVASGPMAFPFSGQLAFMGLDTPGSAQNRFLFGSGSTVFLASGREIARSFLATDDVPEPLAGTLLALGLAALAIRGIKRRSIWLALGCLALPTSARALPPEAIVRDIEVREDGATVYVFSVRIDGMSRIGFVTRTDPADPATESAPVFVPRLPGAMELDADVPTRLSPSGRFIAGASLHATGGLGAAIVRGPGLVFDTRTAGAQPVVIPAPDPSLLPPDAVANPNFLPDFVSFIPFDVSDRGGVVGFGGTAVLFVHTPGGVFLGGAFKAGLDGRARPVDLVLPGEVHGGALLLRSSRDGRAAVGITAARQFGLFGLPVFVDERGRIVLRNPVQRLVGAAQPSALAQAATRERGRIIAAATDVTSLGTAQPGAGTLVYDSAQSVPVYFEGVRPQTADLLVGGAADSTSDARAFVGVVGPVDPAAPTPPPLALVEVLSGTALGPGEPTSFVRVPGASVFGSGDAGFELRVPGDRPGSALRVRSLLPDLAEIPGSGFSADSLLLGCFVGERGARASIFCQGVNAQGEPISFSDRLRVGTAPDADGDGVADGADNCPFAPNAGQSDAGGVASPADPAGSTPDGVGDACQCGDASGDGRVTGVDSTLLARCALGLTPCGSAGLAALPGGIDRCDVGGAPGCDAADATVLKRATLGLAPAIQPVCKAFTGTPPAQADRAKELR